MAAERDPIVTVYTAITAGYDDLREPDFVSPRCRYICFTDDASLTSVHWELRALQARDVPQGDGQRLSRAPKLLPHRYLPDADVSVWIDANLTIRGDLAAFADQALANDTIAHFRHPESRASLYAEAIACIRLKKDDPFVIATQMDGYAKEDAPVGQPIPANMIIARRHRETLVIKMMELWWRELLAKSRRDQLSFTYAAFKTGVRYRTIDGNSRDNEWVLWRKHDSLTRGAKAA